MDIIRRKRIAQALRMRPSARRTRALARLAYVQGEELTWDQPKEETAPVAEEIAQVEPEVVEKPKRKRIFRPKSER
jgi:hypothetical protein